MRVLQVIKAGLLDALKLYQYFLTHTYYPMKIYPPATLWNEINTLKVSRKNFLSLAGKGLVTGIVGGMMSSCQTSKSGMPPVATTKPVSPPSKVPAKIDEPIELEAWKSSVDRQSPPTPSPLPPEQRVGYALVGLGHLSLEELLPAFASCKKSKPVALVSGNPEKMKHVALQYGIKAENCYSYETYDQLKNNPEVQVIYIVLPNSMHAEFTIRGAASGKHILCEKPMATSSKECLAMIDACKKANRKLMIAYRIQYEQNNRYIRDLISKEVYGKVKYIEAFNMQSSANPAHWRHKLALAGGGALPDIGIYCLNTLRFILGQEPTEVFAYQYSTPGNPLFTEVEEVISWQMLFPNGIITSNASHYNTHDSRFYRVNFEKGWVNLQAAFAYEGQQIETSHAEGMIVKKEQPSLNAKNQFATEMDHFSTCILENLDPYTPGEEGLQDHVIMEAIYQSAREGRPVKLKEIGLKDAFRGPEPKGL